MYETSGAARLDAVAPSWLGIGAAAAFVVSLVRELGRNTITALSGLGKHRGYAVLGAAPELTPRAMRELPPDQRSPLGCLTYMPASSFATAFRDLQGALSRDKLVAVIAPMPGDGATTVALSVAVSAVQQGRSVIVVDCDLRRRALTRALGAEPAQGVLEACERPEYWRDFVAHESETGLSFMPAARPANLWRSLTSAPGFRGLLQHLRAEFDLVVLDCPPALVGAEGSIIARFADRSVVIVVWDQTPLAAVRATVRGLGAGARATGVYVNRVPPGYRFGRLRPD